MATPEGMIEKSILRYLSARSVFAFKIKSMGTFDPTRKVFRKPSPLYRKGVSDILGIYNGVPIAIEVKSPKGRVSPDQESFLKDFVAAGGRALVARSVEHVAKFLDLLDSPATTQVRS